MPEAFRSRACARFAAGFAAGGAAAAAWVLFLALAILAAAASTRCFSFVSRICFAVSRTA